MSYVNPYLAKLDITKLSEKERRYHLDRHYTQLRKFVQGACQDKFHQLYLNDMSYSAKSNKIRQTMLCDIFIR